MKVEIVEKTFGAVVEIEESVSMLSMAKTLGNDYVKLQSYLKESSDPCEGIPYTRYLSVNWAEEVNKSKLKMIFEVFTKKWNFRAGIPSVHRLESSDEIKSEFLNTSKFVFTIHQGPYENVGNTYNTMVNWAEENGVNLKGESIEFYTNDPSDVPAEKLRTEVYIPIE